MSIPSTASLQQQSQSESSELKMNGSLIVFKNEHHVLEYSQNQTNLKLVIFEGSVYDVADYLQLHPGGSDMIEPYLGKSIDEPFEENEHTKTARNQFNSLPKIGQIASTKVFTNSNESTSDDDNRMKVD